MEGTGHLDTQEALSQIRYMQQLLDDTRIRVADGYAHFLMWGVLWVFGYSSYFFLPASMAGAVWLLLVPVGVIGGMVIGKQQHQDGPPATPFTRRLMWLNLIFFAMLFLIPFVTGMQSETSFNAFFPFYIGFLYLVNGIFIGREMVMIGAWLLLVGIATRFMPGPAQHLWLAVAGGGSLLLTGILLRQQVKS